MNSTSALAFKVHRKAIQLVAGCALLGLVIGLIGALVTDDKWLIGAKVLLQIGPETAGTRPSMVGSPAPFLSGNPRREDVQTEVELLSSSDLLRRAFANFVIEDRNAALGPEPGFISTTLRSIVSGIGLLPPRTLEDRAIDQWAGSLRVAVVPSSTVLVLECKSERPKAAERLLAIMLDLYLDDHRRAFGARGMAPILGSYVGEREVELAKAEAALVTVRGELGIVDIVNETLQLEKRRSESEATAKTIRGALAAANARVQAHQTMLTDTPAELRTSSEQRPNPTRDELDLRIAKAKEDLAVAQQQFVEASPQIRQAREVVTVLQALADQQPITRQAGLTLGRDPLHDSLRDQLAKAVAEVRGLTAEVSVAEATVTEIGTQLQALEKGRPRLQKAEQDVLEARKDVAQTRDGMRLAQIEQVLDEHKVSNVAVVMKPNYLPTALRTFGLPSRIAIVLGCFAFGIALGVALVLWRSPERTTDVRSQATTG
jgi:uncharacterized protein involved in exopolysaccharide biosynthesis